MSPSMRGAVARVSRPRAGAAVGACGAAVGLLALAGCGDQQAVLPQGSSAPTASTVQLGDANCDAAAHADIHLHNICAYWLNEAPIYVKPGPPQAGTADQFTSAYFTPTNSTTSSGDPAVDAAAQMAQDPGDGASPDPSESALGTYDINQRPGSFGTQTWGATSAKKGYTAFMTWGFTVKEPTNNNVTEQLSGRAIQGSNSSSAECGTGIYTTCVADKPQPQPPPGKNSDGDQQIIATYHFRNAPLQVNITNNTGQTMTRSAVPTYSGTVASKAGTGFLPPAGQASPSPTATPSGDPGATLPPIDLATTDGFAYAMYRAVSGPTVSFGVTYEFPDSNPNLKVTHVVTINIQVAQGATPVTTADSKCTDNPVGGSSSPQEASCSFAWTGTSSPYDAASVRVRVNNS